MNVRPLPPQGARSRKIAFFACFSVLFSPKTVLSCATTNIVSRQSGSECGQICGQNPPRSKTQLRMAEFLLFGTIRVLSSVVSPLPWLSYCNSYSNGCQVANSICLILRSSMTNLTQYTASVIAVYKAFHQ